MLSKVPQEPERGCEINKAPEKWVREKIIAGLRVFVTVSLVFLYGCQPNMFSSKEKEGGLSEKEVKWYEKLKALKTASVEITAGLPQFPIVSLPDIGNGIIVQKNSQFYLISDEHVLEKLIAPAYQSLSGQRDMAIMKIPDSDFKSLGINIGEAEAKKKALKYDEVGTISIADVNGKTVFIMGYKNGKTYVISGEALFTSTEMATIFHKVPENCEKCDITYSLNRFIVKLSLGFGSSETLSGSPFFILQNDQLKLAGLMLGELKTKKFHILVLGNPYEFEELLNKIP